ncbi:hypothetical protein Vadar_001895 [Vaccinium darrowii]|uniref:Uncharacterized protein n=1 Tax=Vaccinium darrowii TaxID=229202 RepID=A0ACB7WX57_9ERIC|nr:hypothetical protein Vadar_001895 [Vaccinium darrowii]
MSLHQGTSRDPKSESGSWKPKKRMREKGSVKIKKTIMSNLKMAKHWRKRKQHQSSSKVGNKNNRKTAVNRALRAVLRAVIHLGDSNIIED